MKKFTRDEFMKNAKARGVLELSTEMLVLLDFICGDTDEEPKGSESMKDESPKDESGTETNVLVWSAKHKGKGKYDVIDKNGKVHADGNNLPKDAAEALAAKLNTGA